MRVSPPFGERTVIESTVGGTLPVPGANATELITIGNLLSGSTSPRLADEPSPLAYVRSIGLLITADRVEEHPAPQPFASSLFTRNLRVAPPPKIGQPSPFAFSRIHVLVHIESVQPADVLETTRLNSLMIELPL